MHQSCGADTSQQVEGGWREEHGALRREERGQEGTAAVWASSLLARLLKVIIEFLCRASPPCGILLCIHYKVDRQNDWGNLKSWPSPMLLCNNLIYATNKRSFWLILTVCMAGTVWRLISLRATTHAIGRTAARQQLKLRPGSLVSWVTV